MFNFKNCSIKTKLILIFIIFKVIPLLLLATVGVMSFLSIDALLKKSSEKIVKQSQSSIHNTTNKAISDSIKALDQKSQSVLEDKTKMIAEQVADFLYQRDADILFLSKLKIENNILEKFYAQKMRSVYLPPVYRYNAAKKQWTGHTEEAVSPLAQKATLKDNSIAFHKIPRQITRKKNIPIYKEVSFYDPTGKELYKVSSIDPALYDISDKYHTYLHAETYFDTAKKLKEGEIYVSHVIGTYLPSPVIGTFTPEKAKKANIPFEPQNYGYAGKENPVGKIFEGIVRFVTPVYREGSLKGYLTLALDHHHLMDMTDFVNPLSPDALKISDASNGNYAFMWDNNFSCISHPRDYFIVGYDAKTGKRVPGWIDADLAQKFKKSSEHDLNTFLQKQPPFLNQSLQKKPNVAQIKTGQLGLDCRYLNFAPQCEGWSGLVNDGGYGSFVIFWSKVWKLTTAATIPYYTGEYGDSKRGFGFVTIGANVAEFHMAATQTKQTVEKTFEQENKIIEANILAISDKIYENIKSQINKMGIITLILIILVIYVATIIANSASKRINKIIIGTQKIKEKNFDYQIECNSHDELGRLTQSFNEMAYAISILNNDLHQKLFTDELTQLHNRTALRRDIKALERATLFLIDIDSFKNINDFYGSLGGNFILQKLSAILGDFAKKHSLKLYRIGSDEFVLLKNSIYGNSVIDTIITELHQVVTSTRFKNDELSIDTTISFACGIANDDTNLIEHADLALNEAKKRKQLYMLYDHKNPHMNRHTEYILWKEKIQYAIKNDNIVPYFQPIIDVKNPDNKKYEALIRMIDNDNVIAPYMFLDIAKESKLYPQLTRIMMEKTCRIFENRDALFSVNISINDIQDKETVTFMKECIEKYGVGNKIIFEILESEEIVDFETTIDFIEHMRSQGVRFAIDDFGSGYSNFSYILQMRPDFIKIDGSLIKNITQYSNEYYVVSTIVKFAKSLNIKLIAEYVSTKEIVDILEELDIDYMQGYYFSEPQVRII